MFKDLFKSESQDKLTDKTFIRLIVTSILAITICIVCLCSSTWAWFNTSVSGSGNEIKSAGECLLEIKITVPDPGDTTKNIPLADDNGNAITNFEEGVNIVPGKIYTVTLTLPAGATSSGYCLISTGGVDYCSEYIYRESAPNTVVFNLTVEQQQKVTFTPRWGIFLKDPDVKNGETINIKADGTINISAD